MSKYETTVEHLREYVNGMHILFEVTEYIKDGVIQQTERVVADRAYYTYLDLKETYARGQITRELLEIILEADGLKRFVKDGDLILAQDGISTEEMDRRYEATKLHEAKWQAAMVTRTKYPQSFVAVLRDIIGETFKTLESAEKNIRGAA